MTDGADHELRAQFQSLRRETGGQVPPFRDTLAARVRRPRRVTRFASRLWAMAAAAALALVLFAVVRPHGSRATLVDLARVRWEAPTDFLLQAPGAELLRTIPTFTTDGRLLP